MASFLSVTNGRPDDYGGSLENRLRLPLEVVRAVRERDGPGFVVGCRYLGSEDILREDGRIDGNTIDDACAIGVALARGRPRLPVGLAGRQVRGREAAARRRGGLSRTPATAAIPASRGTSATRSA